MDDRADAEIIAASIGTPTEFAAIFDRHYETVRRYAARRLGADAADDLAAQTFEEGLKARRRFDARQPSARAWLLGIATNLIRHHHRSETRRAAAFVRLERPEDASDHAEAVQRRVDADRVAATVHGALLEMSDGDRDTLLLFAWADLTYEEIAAALRIPVGTVRSRLNRARGRLREQLARSGQYLNDNATSHELVNVDG
jgi:RNA polymerase sigma-70 factor (ECF subfamily)